MYDLKFGSIVCLWYLVFLVGQDVDAEQDIWLSTKGLMFNTKISSPFSEILRVIDSIQLTATKKVATPANWQVGVGFGAGRGGREEKIGFIASHVIQTISFSCLDASFLN